MRPIFSNRYVDALAKTLIVFGVIHWIILTCIVVRGDVEVLNAFNILQLDALMPSLRHGTVNLALSYGVVLVGYGFAYLCLARPMSDHQTQSPH